MNFAAMLLGEIKIKPRRVYHAEKTKPELVNSLSQYKALLVKPMTAKEVATARGLSYNGVKSFLDRALERGDVEIVGKVTNVENGKFPSLYLWVGQ